MKKYILPAIAVLSILTAVSCSTKFDVAAPYKNIMVIYAFLDQNDTAHYVRIEKAFLDQNKNALTMAGVADSSYFQNLNVKIERIDFLNTGNIIDTIHLNRVDLNNEGYPKQSGVFFNSPNYAYKFKNTLNVNYSYRIVVTNTLTGEVDSSETPVISDNAPSNTSIFTVPIIDNSFTNLAGLEFSSTLPFANLEITGSYTPPSNYSFTSPTKPGIIQTSPVAVAQLVIRFNWVDSNILTGTITPDSFDYNAGFYGMSGNNIDYKISNTTLYQSIASAMGTAPANIVRLMQKCEVLMYVGTPDFYNYQAAAAIQGTGLTANEIEPIYTNIAGANALGLYTSRGLRMGKTAITPITLDSLEVSPYTAASRIVGYAH